MRPAVSSPDAAAMTRALTGYSELRGLHLQRNPADGTYDLHLTLANKQQAAVVLHCQDVQNLELNPNGISFSRLIDLSVQDVREDGLDRIHFTVEELAEETLFFHCGRLQLGSED